MATFQPSWQTDNTTGTTGYRVMYRVTGTTVWTVFATSGTTAIIHGFTDNTLYDMSIQNVNNFDNPTSPIVTAIGFTDPLPILSPTMDTIAYSFTDQSASITSYAVTIALASAPEVILETQYFNPPVQTMSGTFTGLISLTSYIITIIVVSTSHSSSFGYGTTTTATGICASPTHVSALLTSGNVIQVTWTDIAVRPACGYQILYRAEGQSSYSIFTTSGTASGTTSVLIHESAPACYEGFVQSNCCGDNISGGSNVSFGINAYSPLYASVHLYPVPPSDPSQYRYQLILSSLYPNPYNTLVTGSFDTNWPSPTTIPFTETYVAGSTHSEYFFSAPGFPNITVLSNLLITSVAPIFDNGGNLQQFDTVSTPQYFRLFNTSGCTSGITTSGCTAPVWIGSPATLPSFVQNQFIVTEVDTLGNVLQGQLFVQWIYDHIYGGGVSPYNTVTLSVYDSTSALMGSVTVSTATIGLRGATILLNKRIDAITSTNQFYMKAFWSDVTQIGTGSIPFYLPLF